MTVSGDYIKTLGMVALLFLCWAAQPAEAAKSVSAINLLLLDGGDQVVTPPVYSPPPAEHLDLVFSTDFLVIPEGGTASFGVKLSAPPPSPMSVNLSRVSGDGDIAVDGASAILTFNAENWNTYQSVALSAAQDNDFPDASDGLAEIVGVTGSLVKTLTAKEADDDRAQDFGSHYYNIASYEGPSTCLSCHGSEQSVAPSLHESAHYQWKGDAYPHIEGSYAGEKLGKLGGINDFCTFPDINWLGKMTTVDGRTVDGGCAKCHVGMGEKPSPDTYAPENVDCLVCHSPDYKRHLVAADTASGFVYEPNTAKMAVSTLEAARNIQIPDKQACLNCHTKSGGGNNFKRGDIEEFHRSPTRQFDVHMASVSDGGLGFDCVTCHTPDGHLIPGRGSDLPAKEGGEVTCASDLAGCHGGRGESPHVSVANASRLNEHAKRINCNVCHIPSFAKMAATDMFRDYSVAGDLVHSSLLYEPHLTMGSDVTPEYRFFDGTSRHYRFGDVAEADTDGYVTMSAPLGGNDTPGAKLNPFKVHGASMARDIQSGALIPLKMGILFQTGDNETAITTGAAQVGWPMAYGYDFVETRRYQGIYHGVEPSENALTCTSCHDGNRVDFAALGYEPTNPVSPSCGRPDGASCHGDKTDDYAGKGFTWLHDKHVDDERINCSTCHSFSAPR